jgi:hypothetical protein
MKNENVTWKWQKEKIKTFISLINDGWEPTIIVSGAKGADCADGASAAAIVSAAQYFAYHYH